MMYIDKRASSIAAGIGMMLLAASALATDFPQRKSGLWEITSQPIVDGQRMPANTMQICIEQGRDDVTGDPRNARRQCPKVDVKRINNKTVIDSVCKLDGRTAFGHTVISGDLSTNYQMNNTTRFDPPMNGMQVMSSTMSGRWAGPCKPGQKHGATVMPGMGPGGQMRLDPDILQRMQQMQQQYGR